MRAKTKDAVDVAVVAVAGLLLAAGFLWAGWALLHALPLLLTLAIASVGLTIMGAACLVRLICSLLAR